MSDHMKTPHTEIFMDGMVFLLPKNKKESLLNIFNSLGVKLKSKNIKAENLMQPLYKNLPKGSLHMRAARLKEGFSQKKLADETGIPIYNISKMENGQRPIGSKIANKLGKILKVNVKLLMQK